MQPEYRGKTDFMTAPDTVVDLVEAFLADASNKDPKFKEDWVRTDFIEPLLAALGWTRINHYERTTKSTGYVREEQIDAEGKSTVPDYAMYVNGYRAFYIEAKKPHVDIETEKAPAFQIRDYGWNSGDAIGLLTDFEELAVYNCRVEPAEGQDAAIGRVHYLTCDDYVARWEWLRENFSPDAVADGSLNRLADEFSPKSSMRPVDQVLLSELEKWRVDLAADLIDQNADLSKHDLNFAVQTVIDRVLFLRVAEARGLESDGTLAALANEEGIYSRFLELCYLADTRYNSGLFHFSDEKGRPTPDSLTPALTISDEPLRAIISRLTDPSSPYLFDIMPADILGQMYEQMLGKVLEQQADGSVELKLKPEVQKAGGVYYTPEFVVRHIVHETLAPLLKNKTPSEVESIKIVDPSCGSGSFLLGAYQYLLDWHLAYYAGLKRPKRTSAVRINNVLTLTIDERKKILLNNIHGVDIDAQAVEVAKLSLLLKVVEEETQLGLAVERLLPDLHNNLKCGNSLVGSDFYASEELVSLTAGELTSVNVFDWKKAFPTVAVAEGFDAVVGNPPWLMAGYHIADQKPYLQRHFTTWTGKADLYYLFLEKACRITRPQGRIGMIVPSKLFHTRAGGATRELLAKGDWIESIVDFGTAKIFKSATNYSCILQLKQGSKGQVTVVKADNYFANREQSGIARERLGRSNWHLLPEARHQMWEQVASQHPPLSELTERFGTGVQTGRDPLLMFDKDDPRIDDFGVEHFRPSHKGRDVRRYTCSPSKLMFFPYEVKGETHQIVELDSLTDSLVAYLTEKGSGVDHEQSLRDRVWFDQDAVELAGRWYGLMFVDQPWTFQRPHLLTPGISDRSNFALGDGSVFVTGTAGVNSVVPRTDIAESPLYLLALLNSSLLSQYIVDHSTPYQGGYFKFSTNYIKNTPIRRIDFDNDDDRSAHDELVALAAGIADRKSKSQSEIGSDLAATEKVVAASEARIDEIVNNLYGVAEIP